MMGKLLKKYCLGCPITSMAFGPSLIQITNKEIVDKDDLLILWKSKTVIQVWVMKRTAMPAFPG